MQGAARRVFHTRLLLTYAFLWLNHRPISASDLIDQCVLRHAEHRLRLAMLHTLAMTHHHDPVGDLHGEPQNCTETPSAETASSACAGFLSFSTYHLGWHLERSDSRGFALRNA